MKPSHPHLLKLTITGLNALAMQSQALLFRRGIRRHIDAMDGNHSHTVASIELMAKRFTHIATVAEEY